MVPKIHAKGTSFKGAAAYLLHDKDRAQTSDRVAWVQMENLITHDPQVGWRVMAATAMDQDRLKELAGVKKTGRKSDASVLHLTLSWHPDEKEGLTKQEMLRAAKAAIRTLDAGDRQAMIIHHSDEEHPHVHILINRVSPEDGRMLSSSKEKLSLSKWAEAYEKDRGVIYCEERVLNNEARDKGQYTRGKKDQARHIYEQTPANDNSVTAQTIKSEQRKKDAGVAKNTRETRSRHRKQWQDLHQRYRQREAAIKAQSVLNVTRDKEAIRAKLRPERHELLREHQAELRHFLNNEKSFLGRVSNALRSIDFKALVAGQTAEPERRQTLGEAFDALASSGVRMEALKKRQEKQKRELDTKERREEKDVEAKARAERGEAILENRQSFERERNDLILAQRLEGAKHRSDWKTRNEQREKAWAYVRPFGGGQGHTPDRTSQLLKMIERQREKLNQLKKDRDHGNDRDDR